MKQKPINKLWVEDDLKYGGDLAAFKKTYCINATLEGARSAAMDESAGSSTAMAKNVPETCPEVETPGPIIEGVGTTDTDTDQLG